MHRRSFLVTAFMVWMFCRPAPAEPITVTHIQRPMHRFMVARSESGALLARGEFTQTVQGDEVSMRLTYRFLDGSVDEETTTYRQDSVFRLVDNHHVQTGPFFARAADFAVKAASGTAITRVTDRQGKVHIEQDHVDLPNDLANGFVGTLLLNVPPSTALFRVGMLVPVGGGRLIRLLISHDSEQPFQAGGKSLRASVFRVHPELGGIIGVVARLIGLQPKDVMVWVQEGDDPAVVRIVGQLGGYGPVVTSELEGTSFAK